MVFQGPSIMAEDAYFCGRDGLHSKSYQLDPNFEHQRSGESRSLKKLILKYGLKRLLS
jgi:hypothetical protein